MGKFRVEVTEIAKKHITQHLKSGNQSSIKRIEKILKDLLKPLLKASEIPNH